MDRILIIMKKNNGHQGIICPFTGAFFHNMQTCLLVYTYNKSQVSVYRTIGPLVAIYSHGGHLGHVTLTNYINFLSPFPRMLHMKFGFDWPSGFRGEMFHYYGNIHVYSPEAGADNPSGAKIFH